jgi:hypothetical protein
LALLKRVAARSELFPLLLFSHLGLVLFAVMFVFDNCLTDYPTNLLFFFIVFANEAVSHRVRLATAEVKTICFER